MVAFSGKKWAFISTLILIVLMGCSGTRPTDSVDGTSNDVETLKSKIYEQGIKI
jgi:hypothetical protein